MFDILKFFFKFLYGLNFIYKIVVVEEKVVVLIIFISDCIVNVKVMVLGFVVEYLLLFVFVFKVIEFIKVLVKV